MVDELYDVMAKLIHVLIRFAWFSDKEKQCQEGYMGTLRK
jgi:hypothetical protein